MISMKALVIGYGSIGSRHIENLTNYLKIQCVVLSQRKNDSFLKKNNCILVNSLKDGINEKPDFAVIANETHLHLKTAMKIAKSKIPFLIEKPLSNNLKNVENLIHIIKQNKISTLVGCNLRFHPCFIETKKIILKKKLGQIISVQSQNSSYLPNWHPDEDYSKSYSAKKKSGGIVYTCIHEIDYLFWFFGKVSFISSSVGKYSNLKIKTDDLAEIILKFKNQMICNLHLDFNQKSPIRYCRIIGTKGILHLNFLNSELSFFDYKINKWKILLYLEKYDSNSMYVDELNHFVDCIIKNKKSINPIIENYEILKVADAIQKSSKNKKMVMMK
jgi:predicted dehydrogenase